MTATMPTQSTKQWERKSKAVQKDLRAFLKSKGVNSKRKILAAAKRAQVRG